MYRWMKCGEKHLASDISVTKRHRIQITVKIKRLFLIREREVRRRDGFTE